MNYIKQYSSIIKIAAPVIAIIAYFLPFASFGGISVPGFSFPGLSVTGFNMMFSVSFFSFLFYAVAFLAAVGNLVFNFIPQPKIIKLALAAGSAVVILLAAIFFGAWGIGMWLFLIFQAFNAFTINVTE